MPAFWKLPFVFRRFNEGFQVFKGFHGIFFKEGGCYPEAEVSKDLWRCYRENMVTGKTWDGVSTKGREPVFRVQGLIKEALFGGKKDRAFFGKVRVLW